MKPELMITYFQCGKCGTWRTVETIGTVLGGPLCGKCHTPMKKVEVAQLELGLFPEPKAGRTRSRKSNKP